MISCHYFNANVKHRGEKIYTEPSNNYMGQYYSSGIKMAEQNGDDLLALFLAVQRGWGQFRAQELCESRGGRPGFPVPGSPYGLCGRKATLNLNWSNRGQELCESRGGRPGFPVPDSPYGLCGRKATLNLNSELGSCVKVEMAVLGSLSLTVLMVDPVPSKPCGFCGR